MILIMRINKPIFIVGSGRSGTTLLHDILAINENVAWISNLTNKFYRFPQLTLLHRILELPLIGNKLKQNIINETSWNFIRPSEGENIYQKFCGYGVGKILTKNDMSSIKNTKLKQIIKSHLYYSNKHRFINKSPSNVQRIEILNLIFPDAYFIHIIRDGRAVVNSLNNVSWWKDIKLWWAKGKLPADLEKQGMHPLIIKARHWENNVKEVRRHQRILKDRYMEIYYEDFIRDVPGTIKMICDFCSLKYSDKYLSLIPLKFSTMDYKWKRSFNMNERRILNKYLKKTLDSMGYK